MIKRLFFPLIILFFLLSSIAHATVLVDFVTNVQSIVADAGGISDSDTTLNLDTGDGASLPALTGGTYIYAIIVDSSSNWEIIKCTAISTDALTIERGAGGTTPRAFAQNDVVYFPATHIALDEIVAGINTNETNLTTHEADTSTHGVTLVVGSTESQSMSNKEINSSNIGASTPGTGGFTTLSASTDPTDADGVGDRGFNDTRHPFLEVEYSPSASSSQAITLNSAQAYKIIFELSTSASAALSFNLNSDSGSNYNYRIQTVTSSTSISSVTSSSSVQFSGVNTVHFGEIVLSANSAMSSNCVSGYSNSVYSASTGIPSHRVTSFRYNGSAVLSGMTISPSSGTITGTIRVIRMP